MTVAIAQAVVAIKMKKLLILVFMLSIQTQAIAKHQYPEKDYQKYWCDINNGITEYRLNDSTRIDCLTNEYAIEFDFANKWAESIGQALYYGIMTCKKPGIVLILENPKKDLKYLNRLKEVAKEHNITIWTIMPNSL